MLTLLCVFPKQSCCLTKCTRGGFFLVDALDDYESPLAQCQGPCEQACFGNDGVDGMCFRFSGDFLSIPQSMARFGFAGISKSLLQELLYSDGVGLFGDVSEYEVVKTAILRWEKKIKDEDLLRRLAKRSHQQNRIADEEFYQDEAVMSCFDDSDLKEVQSSIQYLGPSGQYMGSVRKAAKAFRPAGAKGSRKVSKKEQEALNKQAAEVPINTDRKSNVILTYPWHGTWQRNLKIRSVSLSF